MTDKIRGMSTDFIIIDDYPDTDNEPDQKTIEEHWKNFNKIPIETTGPTSLTGTIRINSILLEEFMDWLDKVII